MPPLPSLDETDHTLPSISQMSIAEIKHELLSLNNPSFVFNQRDDLESALRAARIKTRRTDDVGLAVGVGSGGGLSSGSGSGSGNSTSAALHAAKSNTPSSNNSNGDKPNSESNGNNSVGSNNLNVNLNLNAIDNHTATTSASTAMWSDLEDLAEDKDELSRRLVEYFVMVSSVPISEDDPEIDPNSPAKNDGKSKAAQKSRRANKSRPPDPSRDKMNSRTAGRFEVRRAHLMKYSEPEQEQGGGHDSYAALGGIAESNHGGKAMTRQNSVDSTASTDEEDDGTPGRVVKFQPSVPLAFGTSKNSVNSAELEKQQSSQQQQQQQQQQQAEDDIEDYALEPVITARYPKEDYPDQPLNIRLPHFCHPEGTDFIFPTREYKMPRIHHFVLTDSLGGKQYGTCLTVYEEFFPPGKEGEEYREKKKKDKSLPTFYAPRVLCLLSTYPYLSSFRTYLTQLYRLATSTNVMTAPIERYVQNICSEIPAPPPGAFEVKLNILGSTVRFWAPPADQPIPYVSLPFKVLFECLDIGNVLFAWYTLACERKVLLVSSQLSLLTVCAEILQSLLFPMRWSHLYIPVLPRSLSPMLDAPMPYLCGISRENFPYAVADISDETIVVDLDRNIITLGPNTPDLPPLPHKRRMKLESALKANAGEVFWEARNLCKEDVLNIRAAGDEVALSNLLGKAGAVWDEKMNTRDDAFNLAHAPDSMTLEFNDDARIDANDGKQSRWDAVQEAFLRFYVAMLQDYRKFLPVDASPDARTSWRGSDGVSEVRFRAEDFVLAQSPDFQPFLEELIGTQQFDDFVTKRMYNAGNAPDVTFFDQSIDAKKNRSKLKFKKVETPFLHSASAHKDLKSADAVEPTAEGLPPLPEGQTAYMYKMWPLEFDESLFGRPRPIPKIISAEFDRMNALKSMLRAQHGFADDTRGSGGRNKSPEVTAFVLFFTTFTSVIGKELAKVERKHGTEFGGTALDVSVKSAASRMSLIEIDDNMEVARTIAKAQIDLAYHTLTLMQLRKLPAEPVTYKLLIEACGRCKVSHRATQLMKMLTYDGLAANSEIHSSFITAFSRGDEADPSAVVLYNNYGDTASDISSSFGGSLTPLREENRSEHSIDMISELSPVPSESSKSKKSIKTTMKSSLNRRMFRKVKPRRRKVSNTTLTKKKNLATSNAITKQIELGESLLESLYPGIVIDTESDSCPKCAQVLSNDEIIVGWTPCASKEYQTTCPSCKNKFVPKFSVSCKNPEFVGSQGKGTTLFCDYLSPWVLLREIRGVMNASGGFDKILDEKFRSGSDINATLWWNMIVTFDRFKLPYIFLLQGSFKNQLILPSPTLNESSNDVYI